MTADGGAGLDADLLRRNLDITLDLAGDDGSPGKHPKVIADLARHFERTGCNPGAPGNGAALGDVDDTTGNYRMVGDKPAQRYIAASGPQIITHTTGDPDLPAGNAHIAIDIAVDRNGAGSEYGIAGYRAIDPQPAAYGVEVFRDGLADGDGVTDTRFGSDGHHGQRHQKWQEEDEPHLHGLVQSPLSFQTAAGCRSASAAGSRAYTLA